MQHPHQQLTYQPHKDLEPAALKEAPKPHAETHQPLYLKSLQEPTASFRQASVLEPFPYKNL